jgi:hypothetical protein
MRKRPPNRHQAARHRNRRTAARLGPEAWGYPPLEEQTKASGPNVTRRPSRARPDRRLERLEDMPTPRLDRLVRAGVLSDVLQPQALLDRRKDRRQ